MGFLLFASELSAVGKPFVSWKPTCLECLAIVSSTGELRRMRETREVDVSLFVKRCIEVTGLLCVF